MRRSRPQARNAETFNQPVRMALGGFRLPETSKESPDEDLLRLAWGFRATQVVYVAAELGVADVSEHGPATADAIVWRSGFATTEIHKVRGPMSIIEAKPV